MLYLHHRYAFLLQHFRRNRDGRDLLCSAEPGNRKGERADQYPDVRAGGTVRAEVYFPVGR